MTVEKEAELAFWGAGIAFCVASIITTIVHAEGIVWLAVGIQCLLASHVWSNAIDDSEEFP